MWIIISYYIFILLPQIILFFLSHFFPDGVRHHTRKIAQGTLIANNIAIVPIICPPFLSYLDN